MLLVVLLQVLLDEVQDRLHRGQLVDELVLEVGGLSPASYQRVVRGLLEERGRQSKHLQVEDLHLAHEVVQCLDQEIVLEVDLEEIELEELHHAVLEVL